ncbi:DUF3267 domain-containing protein [Fredinandcohnia sp. 179-A 10B2 NHS]|uniref:DUF3267 domain-containing protein n=1 Tax=Fredinandcohnia sp. 179-A 10B2 NHS TaxID=3235176 RepID=UPI00399F7052
MTCWKTINLSKDYGFHRITLISFISMFMAFILFYLPLNLMYSSIDLREEGSLFFVLALVLIYPLHELLHIIPFWLSGKRITIILKWYGAVPVISTRSKYSLSKPFITGVLLTPCLVLTFLLLGACILFPGYIHYFTIAAAINFGLCVPDFIYLKQIIRAPKSCLIEEIEDGYDILINN